MVGQVTRLRLDSGAPRKGRALCLHSQPVLLMRIPLQGLRPTGQAKRIVTCKSRNPYLCADLQLDTLAIKAHVPRK